MLTAESLLLQRQGRPVCGPLSFTLAAGEILWVRGCNGAGKSTLLHTLLGFLPAQGALIWRPNRPRLAYLPHAQALPLHLTALEYARAHPAGCALRGAALEAHFLSWGLLRSILHRPLQGLSQGERAQVAIATLALQDASCWLLDEPFAALDPAALTRMQQHLKAACQQGAALIVVSHQSLQDWATHSLCVQRREA